MVGRREFIRGSVATPIALSLAAGAVGADRRSATIFEDGFEDDSPGTVPDGWRTHANDDQKVVDGASYGGAQSFRMAGESGGCWEATAYHSCSLPTEGVVTIQGAVGPTTQNEVGCHDHRGGLNLATGGDDVYPPNAHPLLRFGTESSVTGVGGYDVGSYDVDAWNEFRIRYRRDGDTVRVRYELNGEDRGETSYSAPTWEDEISHLQLRSGDVAVYWDEFSVTTGDDGGGGGGGGDSSEDLRSLSYGESAASVVDEDDPTDYGGFHYEPIDFSGAAGDRVSIEMTSDEFEPVVWLYDPDGDRIANSPDGVETTLPDDGEYTIRAWATPEGETGDYRISLSRSDGGGGGDGGGEDLRSLSYGESAASAVDEDDPTDYGGFHYEPIEFSGEDGDRIEIEMSSDEFTSIVWLYGPDDGVLETANGLLETTLPEDGEYTIRAWATPEGETGDYRISLSRSGGDDTSQYHALRITHPVSEEGLGGVDVQVFNVTGTVTYSGGDDVTSDNVERIARATSSSDGTATFDGSTTGIALETSEFDRYREEYATENDHGILVTCVNDEYSRVGDGTWFDSYLVTPAQFFSSGAVGAELSLSNELLLSARTRDKMQGVVTIWRRLESDPTNQWLYSEISRSAYPKFGAGTSTIGRGTMSVEVPESVDVNYELTNTLIAGDEDDPDDVRYDVASVAASNVVPVLPLYASFNSTYSTLTKAQTEQNEIAAEATKDIFGNVPVTSFFVGAYDIWNKYFAGEEEIVASIGDLPDLSQNTHDTVTSLAWNSLPFSVVHQVPIEFQSRSAQPREFGFNGLWNRGPAKGGRNRFGFSFTFGPGADL